MSLKKAVSMKKEHKNPYKETALLDVKKEEIVAILVKMPISMHTDFKTQCSSKRITMSEFVINCISDFIKK